MELAHFQLPVKDPRRSAVLILQIKCRYVASRGPSIWSSCGLSEMAAAGSLVKTRAASHNLARLQHQITVFNHSRFTTALQRPWRRDVAPPFIFIILFFGFTAWFGETGHGGSACKTVRDTLGEHARRTVSGFFGDAARESSETPGSQTRHRGSRSVMHTPWNAKDKPVRAAHLVG